MAKSIEERQSVFEDELDERKVALDNYLVNAKVLRDFETEHKEDKEKLRVLTERKISIAG